MVDYTSLEIPTYEPLRVLWWGTSLFPDYKDGYCVDIYGNKWAERTGFSATCQLKYLECNKGGWLVGDKCQSVSLHQPTRVLWWEGWSIYGEFRNGYCTDIWGGGWPENSGSAVWCRLKYLECSSDSKLVNGMCEKPLPKSCPSGYTDNGINCKKTINYVFYTYTCPSGYSVADSGLSSCPKTDSDNTDNNSFTLGNDCNSPTPPTGNCSKSISYKYYEYLCQGKNNFLEPIKNLNTGLNACSKTDSDKTEDNTSTLDDACNSSTPPVNNCQSTEYTCDSTLFKPVYVNGKWVCSPYLCNADMKCGYGTCDLPSKPSLDKYQDVAYNPLQYISNNQCNSEICDYTINAKVSYCESLQCPKGDDIIQDSGKCYKLECPAGTYLSGDKCIKVN